MIWNAAAYRFTPLDNLKSLRQSLQSLGKELELKGTVLLAPEGVNLFVAGRREAVEQLLERLPLGLSEVKWSSSEEQPFRRWLVRLKKEIIAFDQPQVDPAKQPAPRLSPVQLKEWLDQGRPLLLLDTRNTYEVKMGTFKGALDLQLQQFRDFPQAAAALPDSLKEQPVVTFCTGGIRCEKAAPWLQQAGFQQVWQLDGGILRYFEEVGSHHYDGECFVFDRRVGVDPALSETDSVVCAQCLTPLSSEEQADERYRAGQSCPHCFRPAGLDVAERLRAGGLRMPGGVAAENRRPLRIPQKCHSLTLLNCLRELFPQIAENDWRLLAEQGCLLAPEGAPAALDRLVAAGEIYQRITLADIEPDVACNVGLVHVDEALLVIDKPAPLPVHACGRYHRNTLRHLLETALAPQNPRPAHRLDANTSGLMVLSRSLHVARKVQPQFAEGRVAKVYLAQVHGHPPSDDFVCDRPISLESDDKIRHIVEDGLPAYTGFRVLERYGDGTSLLEARPHTGRTQQIRAHLWHLGFPIVGDPTYLPEAALGSARTLGVEEPPMRLFSWKLTLEHPLSGQPVTYSCPYPNWLSTTQASLSAST